MIVLSGANLVLPDRIIAPGTIVIDGDRIAEIRADVLKGGVGGHQQAFAFGGHFIVPGFIDVHVHGISGVDSLDGEGAVARIAAALPRHGVTAFCPTTVACAPMPLRSVLGQIRQARLEPKPGGARVLPAHLESNFISPQYRGAQPASCLRTPGAALLDRTAYRSDIVHDLERGREGPEFSAGDILREIECAAPDVGIVTLAPELEGGLDLIHWLSSRGHRVSLGHSGATYERGLEAIVAGARHATHLFNRMPPLDHRAPGLVGAILQADEIAAELICDGFHVHPALIRMAIAAKGPSRVMAITDGTAAAGLDVGGRARLGGQAITVTESAAVLDDGTLAGSVLTMDRAFQLLVGRVGVSLIDAATLCSTTPARELGLTGHGVIAPGAIADLVILDSQFSVVQTYIGGQPVCSRAAA